MDPQTTEEQLNPGGAYGYGWYMRWRQEHCEHHWIIVSGRVDCYGEHYKDECHWCGLYRTREVPLAW